MLSFNLSDRFGALPVSVKNLLNESRLRPALARAGVLSVVRRGCGVVFCFESFISTLHCESMLEYVSNYWVARGVRFHFLPVDPAGLSACVHLRDCEDSFAKLSKFVDKFIAWKNTNY